MKVIKEFEVDGVKCRDVIPETDEEREEIEKILKETCCSKDKGKDKDYEEFKKSLKKKLPEKV